MIRQSTLSRIPTIWLMVLVLLFALSGTTRGQTGGSTADLGDAPDSSNTTSTDMSAYPDVSAQFPTVFSGPAPFGPKHLNQPLKFYLGNSVSPEDEADTGFDADADGGNNLDTLALLSDRDGADDGFDFAKLAGHCRMTQLSFTVTVSDVSSPMLLNLWLDWDRSGGWGNAAGLDCATGKADEWAVRNHPLVVTAPGIYTFVTPAFLTWNPVGDQPLWVRATLSEAPASAADGSGPRSGYLFGETEDYLVTPQFRLFLPNTIGGQGVEEALPPEIEPGGEFTEPDDIRAIWPQRPDGDVSAGVGVDQLQLQIAEQVGVERPSVSVEVTLFANGSHLNRTIAAGRLAVSDTISLNIDLGEMGIDPALLRSPGRIEASITATDTLGQPSYAGTERIFFHGHESNPKMVVIYGEEAAARQFAALAFDHNPTLSSRLAGMIPDWVELADVAEIGIYDSADPILRELPLDPVADEAGPPAEPIPDPDIPALAVNGAGMDAPTANYLVCLRMWAAPVESNQADLGRTGFWKGRGAHVIISHGAKKVWNGWLNIHGCATISSNRSGAMLVNYQGEHRLRSGGDSMDLNIMNPAAGNASFSRATSVAVINNPSTSGVNVAPLFNFDAMAMLAYGIQERVFDSGLDGEELWVKRVGCGGKVGGGACSSKKSLKEFLFLDPTNSSDRKKFTIMHEFGHALIKMAATGWREDCSFGPKPAGANDSYHTREGIEYSSCAAGEGFGHFISTVVWNLREGPNPDGVFESFDVENGGNKTALCTKFTFQNCDGWGVEVDWMRHLWDYYTNNLPGSPGTPPSLAHMINVYDNADWKKNEDMHASKRIEKHLSDAMLTRWLTYACYNGIRVCK